MDVEQLKKHNTCETRGSYGSQRVAAADVPPISRRYHFEVTHKHDRSAKSLTCRGLTDDSRTQRAESRKQQIDPHSTRFKRFERPGAGGSLARPQRPVYEVQALPFWSDLGNDRLRRYLVSLSSFCAIISVTFCVGSLGLGL